MRRRFYGVIFLFCLFIFISCSSDDKKLSTVSFSLELANEDFLKEVKLFIFSETDILLECKVFSSLKKFKESLSILPPGSYTFVVLTNSDEFFEHNGSIGETYLNDFLLRLSSGAQSPEHVHYGLEKITLREKAHTPVAIQLNRVLSEFSMVISNIPDEVTSIRIEILNSSTGFYPGLQKLFPFSQSVLLAEGSPENNYFQLDPVKLLPVVNYSLTAVKTDVLTYISVSFSYNNGGEILFTGSGPAIQNGGVYTPEVEYEIFRPGIDFEINSINGWQELPPLSVDILMPD